MFRHRRSLSGASLTPSEGQTFWCARACACFGFVFVCRGRLTLECPHPTHTKPPRRPHLCLRCAPLNPAGPALCAASAFQAAWTSCHTQTEAQSQQHLNPFIFFIYSIIYFFSNPPGDLSCFSILPGDSPRRAQP